MPALLSVCPIDAGTTAVSAGAARALPTSGRNSANTDSQAGRGNRFGQTTRVGEQPIATSHVRQANGRVGALRG
jgi:hypothetical protein